MAMPMMSSNSIIHGTVPSCLSSHTPKSRNPTIGTNIRHVVSAIVPSNNKTVEFFGGSVRVPLGVSCGALMYTRYSTK